MQLTIARRGEATSNCCYSVTNKGVKSREIDSLPLCFFHLPIRGVDLAQERSLLPLRLGGVGCSCGKLGCFGRQEMIQADNSRDPGTSLHNCTKNNRSVQRG